MYAENTQKLAQDAPERWSATRNVGTMDEMHRILEAVCVDEVGTCPLTPEEVIEEEDLLSKWKATAAAADDPMKVRFRFRLKEISFLRRGVEGVVSQALFHWMVRGAIHSARDELIQTQGNADWRILAWCIGTEQVEYRQKRQNPNYRPDGRDAFKPETQSQYVRPLAIEDKVNLQLVFVDALEAPEVDLLYEERQLRLSPIFHYCQTGDIRRMPPQMRQERSACMGIVRAYRQFWLASRAPASHGQAPGLAPAQLQAAAKLHKAGTTWRDLSALFGVSWVELRRQVQPFLEDGDDGEDQGGPVNGSGTQDDLAASILEAAANEE